MSKNSVNFGSSVGSGGSGGPSHDRARDASVKLAGNESKDKMYEPKHKKKLVRVLTVVAYVFSVSLAAIMLSLFYVFIYNPEKPSGKQGNPLQLNTNGSINPMSQLNNTDEQREEPRALPVKIPSAATEIQESSEVREALEDPNRYQVGYQDSGERLGRGKRTKPIRFSSSALLTILGSP